VGGYDVFLFQALSNPVRKDSIDQNYMALLVAARALREHGAKHVTAVVPYLAYGRQDKPTRFLREPTTAKLMADLTLEAGIDRLVSWEPHSRQIHGFYKGIRADLLDSLALFVNEFERFRGREDVIAVAPDAGASKYVSFFGRALDLNSAVASKYRPRPEEAVITEVIGDFGGKRVAIVLDDMISSGGTVYALIKKLVEEKGIDQIYLGASHYLGMERAYERMMGLCADYAVKQIVVTDSIPQTERFLKLPCVSVKGLAEIFARVINRIHYDRSVSELFDSIWR
jgi:ribose-phosphate pyrophosphokinase